MLILAVMAQAILRLMQQALNQQALHQVATILNIGYQMMAILLLLTYLQVIIKRKM